MTTDRPRNPPVVAIAAGLFCLVLTFLALQIRAGRDPAIGPAQPAVAERPVVVRRVIVRRIVEGGVAAGSGGATSVTSTPVSSAPAPAPVVSGGS